MNPLMDMESETAILEEKYMEKYKFIYTDNIHHIFPMLLTYSYLDVVKSGNIELFDWIYETLTKFEAINDEDMAFRSFVEACEYGNVEMVKHLMEKFPDININGITTKQFDFGQYFTPISLACYNGNLEVAQLLYESGKIVNPFTPNSDCVLVMDYGSKRKCGIIDYELKERRREVMNWIFSKFEDKRELYGYRFCMEHSFMKEYTKSAISELGKEVVLDVLMSRVNAMNYMMTNYNFPEVKFTFEELFNEEYIQSALEIVKKYPNKFQRYKKLFIGIKTVEDIEWLIRNELIDIQDFKTFIKKLREAEDDNDYRDFLEFIKEVIVNCNLEVLRWVIHQFEPEDLDYIRENGDYKYYKRTSIISQINLTKNELIHLINYRRENIEYLLENNLIGYEFFESKREEDYIIYDYEEINILIKSWNWMVKKDIVCEGNYEDYKKKYFTMAPFVIYGFRDAPDYEDDNEYYDDDDEDRYYDEDDGW